ncbi:signal transduction histidine kinase [Allocatelliglobosispora scoriae]|uniref:histidine kinase n=1 Tax=Allocatelliglobosispora scoriae TaxID=643052 RepID=A0A841BLG6_9ACTN|nr:sensor histidine kinase [Allocatelliglobosispora scoriae]MBB5867660.1 signal transduction histidine kinase [Allocatelliglobosispora scoriae]
MNTSRLTLGARVTMLTLATTLLLTAIAVATAVEASKSREAVDAALNRIGPVRTTSEQLMTKVVDQETGIRGYAVSGAADDLQPYRDGIVAAKELTGQIEAALTDRPDLRDQLREVTTRTESWRTAVAAPVIAAGGRGDLAGARALVNDAARQRFDAIRAAVVTLQEGLRVYREALAAEARHSSERVVVLLFIAAGIVLVSGIITLVGLRRLVTGPVTQVAAQVRSVASGEYEKPIVMDGAPEVAYLARDVDAMRQRIAADLAQMQRLNAELELRASELARSNRDLEQFAYVASHDLQEPLRKVASFCQLLQRRYAGSIDEKADQYIAFAVDGAQRMQQLINDLLAFSRIGRTSEGFTEVDLDQVVADSVAQLEYVIAKTEARVTTDSLPTVWGEAPLLAALVTNLIGNAIKFHKPAVTPQVHISAERHGDEWRITCTDNGIGIEAAYAEKVFVIFQRLHAKDSYAGTGIGLAIAKKIIEYHEGRIWVDTDVTTGASIVFTLPVQPNLASLAGAPTEYRPGQQDLPNASPDASAKELTV